MITVQKRDYVWMGIVFVLLMYNGNFTSVDVANTNQKAQQLEEKLIRLESKVDSLTVVAPESPAIVNIMHKRTKDPKKQNKMQAMLHEQINDNSVNKNKSKSMNKTKTPKPKPKPKPKTKPNRPKPVFPEKLFTDVRRVFSIKGVKSVTIGKDKIFDSKNPHPVTRVETFHERPVNCLIGPCLAMGTEYGGYALPTPSKLALSANPTYYGFGCGEDISFDLTLAAHYPTLKIRLFDPTPRALDHIEAVMESISTNKIPEAIQSDTYLFKGQRHEISGEYSAKLFFESVIALGLSKFQFTVSPWGLWNNDTTLTFNAPSAGVSHTLETVEGNATKLDSNSGSLRVKVFKLETIMKHFGDTTVDILKIDIEGAETQVIPQLITFFQQKKMWPTIWCLDSDIARPSHPAYNAKAGAEVVRSILEAGYGLASSEGYGGEGAAAEGRPDLCFLKK